jgi:hypothetical protein
MYDFFFGSSSLKYSIKGVNLGPKPLVAGTTTLLPDCRVTLTCSQLWALMCSVQSAFLQT